MVIQTLNLAIRFILELTALGMMGFWGWKQTDGWLRFILALGIPIIFMSIWVVFNVPGDPSRSGNAPIVVSGIVRLLIELCFFGFASWATYKLGFQNFSALLVFIILLHYVISYERIIWILKQ
ncbi:MAG: YrdB family protein [Saprospiraceae bacterium]|nr:YrdB family protein [Saprospiraceae bacterium]MBK7810058.1 YrdB family protein [Saprospiraceae bacterium]MBK9629660.1 YrdB family protein [Saprospiraceae bacterium]